MANVLDINLISKLECSSCKEYLQPPIRQCVDGHNFCEPCFGKIEECSICKCEKVIGQNIKLENIINDFRFPCGNAEEGCKVTSKGGDTYLHILECDYRDYPCPIQNCEWNETIQLFRGHYERDHLNSKIDMALNKINYTLKQQPRTEIALSEAYGEVFLIKLIFKAEFVGWNVFHFGHYELTKYFAFEVNIANSVIMKAPCLPMKSYSRTKPQFGIVAFHQLLHPFTEDGEINCTIEIIEK